MMPPSTFRIALVTQLAWSDSRNVMAGGDVWCGAGPAQRMESVEPPQGLVDLLRRNEALVQRGGDHPGSREQPLVAAAMGRDLEGTASPFLLRGRHRPDFLAPWVAIVLCTVVAPIWLLPDQRLERTIAGRAAE